MRSVTFFALVSFFIISCTTEETKKSDKQKMQQAKEKKDEVNYKDLTVQYAMQTKGVLGKNLITAINEKGTEHALEFCNTKAYPLTDSMSKELNATIKRVSDKPRNPKNKATEEQLNHIKKYKEILKEGGELRPIIKEKEDRVYGYYSIVTNQMCLQCHGEPGKDIKKPVMDKLAKLYPNDKATGYDVNQIRGMWVVEMDKK